MLAKNLLLLDHHIQKPLLSIRKYSESLQNLDFYDTQISSSQDHYSFERKHQSYRQGQFQYQISLIENRILEVLQDSCQASLKSFKTLHRIPNPDEDQQPLLIGDESKKDMPYTQEATIKTHLARLRRYVRLVDYMTVSSKVNMLIISSQNVCRALQEYQPKISPNLRGNTWIILSLSIKQEKVAFQPDRGEIRAILENLLNETMSQIEINNSFFSLHEQLAGFVDPDLEPPEFQDFKEVCAMNNNFAKYVEQFRETIARAVETIQIYEEYIQPFIRIYVENVNQPPLSYQIDIEAFHQLINKLLQQDVDLNIIETAVEIGMFQIDASSLKALIKNCAKDCLESVYVQIPRILIRSLEDFHEKITEQNNKLNWTVNDSSQIFVEYFVNYCENVQRAQEMAPDLSLQLQDINGMQFLINGFKIALNEQYKQMIVNANQGMQTFRSRLEHANSSYDSNLSKSQSKLERIVPDLLEKIASIDERLSNPILDDQTQVIRRINIYLDDLAADIQDMMQTTKKINRFQ